ncbi:hypothetical protein VE03_09108 [Pseudogymnoascus sp. 23342-1-I1]|nr:hypothetical protein VE03_09108 [Pseudogymnoascus sp. 23342-1-I1]
MRLQHRFELQSSQHLPVDDEISGKGNAVRLTDEELDAVADVDAGTYNADGSINVDTTLTDFGAPKAALASEHKGAKIKVDELHGEITVLQKEQDNFMGVHSENENLKTRIDTLEKRRDDMAKELDSARGRDSRPRASIRRFY